ncbi:MAG: hypothetical protein R3A48_02105 [Polyangiales bacterium]
MTRSLVFSCLTLLSAATSCATTPVAPPPARGSRFVLVPLSTMLRQRPRRDSAGVQFRAQGTSLEVVALRRVRRRNAWVLVDTAVRAERQCHPTLEMPPGIRLRFWVREDELAPALVRRVSRSAPDGSALAANPGLRVVRDGDLSRIALAPGTQVALGLQEAEVGVAFAEPRPLPEVEAGERLVGNLNLPFLGSGQFMTTRGAPPVYVVERGRVPGGQIAQVRTRCAGLSVRVQSTQVVPVVSVDVEAREEPRRAPEDAVTIPAGTRLRWSDGRLAGRTVADVEVAGPRRSVGALRCHSIRLSVPGVEGLSPARTELCVETPRGAVAPPDDRGVRARSARSARSAARCA